MKRPLHIVPVFLIAALCVGAGISRPAMAENTFAENVKAGQAAYEAEDYAEAAKYFKAALEKKPDQPILNYNLAVSLEQTGDLDGAVRHYKTYLELTPDAEDAKEVKGWIDGLKKLILEKEKEEKQKADAAEAKEKAAPKTKEKEKLEPIETKPEKPAPKAEAEPKPAPAPEPEKAKAEPVQPAKEKAPVETAKKEPEAEQAPAEEPSVRPLPGARKEKKPEEPKPEKKKVEKPSRPRRAPLAPFSRDGLLLGLTYNVMENDDYNAGIRVGYRMRNSRLTVDYVPIPRSESAVGGGGGGRTGSMNVWGFGFQRVFPAPSQRGYLGAGLSFMSFDYDEDACRTGPCPVGKSAESAVGANFMIGYRMSQRTEAEAQYTLVPDAQTMDWMGRFGMNYHF